MRSIRQNISSKRGSLAVETAIFLPLLIIGILTIGYLIRLVSIEERVFHSFADETRLLASKGILNVHALTYERDLEARVLEENRGKITDAEIEPMLFLIPYPSPINGKLYTSIIGASLVYEVDIPIAKIFKSKVTMSDTIVCRSFLGTNNNGATKPFDEMEEKKKSEKVWVFPRSGQKYHDEECGYIKNNPKEYILSEIVTNKYNPCELCKPNKSGFGTLVYCFPTSGEAYHLGSCNIVDKYVISISKDSAEEKGYSACSKCGG